jgi:uncharacterized protein (TIGR02246 family)
MDIVKQTSSPTLISADDVRDAVQVLSDQRAIRDLAVLYSHAVDDHDIAGVLGAFASDGEFHRAGVVSTGHGELKPFYVMMMERYSTTLHVVDSHVIDVQGDTATGIVAGRAELVFNGTLMITSYRYDDTYAKTDGRWVFQARKLKPMYTLPWESIGTGFTDTKRIQWPGTEFGEAAFPETSPTWNTYKD